VAQGVGRHALVDLGGVGSKVDGAVELPRAQRVGRIQAREQPASRQDLALGVTQAPPCAQPFQQYRAEHGVAVLATLALIHAQRHALTVDVADLQCGDLADAKPGAVGHRHCGLVHRTARRRTSPG